MNRTILLSFTPDWFEKLEKGDMKYEYRKHFPEGNVIVYFYVSSPVKAITGLAHFACREELANWKIKYNDYSEDVRARISELT